MTTVFQLTAVLLALGGALTLVRLLRGPTSYDRLVALDTLVIVVVSGVAVHSAMEGFGANLVLLVSVALVGFVSTVAVALLVSRDRL